MDFGSGGLADCTPLPRALVLAKRSRRCCAWAPRPCRTIRRRSSRRLAWQCGRAAALRTRARAGDGL